VGLVYSALSLPIVTANLNQMTLEELRVLEQQVPDWANAFAKWMPKWYMMAVVGVVALFLAALRVRAKAEPDVRLIEFWQRLIARVRDGSNVVSMLACGLFAASALTLFGDGFLDDEDADVRAEIHQAEIRFEAGTDLLVSTLATELVEQSINAMRLNSTHPNALLARDIDESFKTIRSAVDVYSRTPRRDPAAQRALLLGLEISADASSIDTDEVVDAVTSGTSMDATSHADRREEGPLSFRERVKRTAMDMLARDKTSTRELSAERRELTKELLARVVDQFKEAAGKDPIVVLFAEAFGSMLAEAVAAVSSRALLEPTLERLWNAADAGTWRDAAKAEVKTIIDGIDASKHWARAGGGVVTTPEAWFASVKGAADELRSVQMVPSEPGNTLDRARIPPFSREFSIVNGDRRASSLLSDILRIKPLQQQPPLSQDELERLVELLEFLGQSDSATSLRQRIFLVAGDGLGLATSDTVVVDSLKTACTHLAKQGILASGRYASLDRQGTWHPPFVKSPTFNPRPARPRLPRLPGVIRGR